MAKEEETKAEKKEPKFKTKAEWCVAQEKKLNLK